MELKDKTITCVDCKKTFNFTIGEQNFYAQNGFTNEPKRCPDCRKKNKESKNKFKSSTNYSNHRTAN